MLVLIKIIFWQRKTFSNLHVSLSGFHIQKLSKIMRWSHAVSFDFQKILKKELIFSLELKSNNKRLSLTVVKEKKE